jgi:hypothetical protein
MAQKEFTEWWMSPLENALGREHPLLKAGLSALRQAGDRSSVKVQREIGEYYRLIAFYGSLFALHKTASRTPEKPLAPATGNRVNCRSRNRRKFRPPATQISMNNPPSF